MSGWMPIETAPRDGTRVLMFETFAGRCVYPARWIGAPHNIWQRDSGSSMAKPSHWMPIPAPPEGT